MTRKVELPDLVIPMLDLNREHRPKIVVFDEHTLGIRYPDYPSSVRTLVSDPARGAVCEELVVEDLVPSSIRKVGIHQIDVQHLFG